MRRFVRMCVRVSVNLFLCKRGKEEGGGGVESLRAFVLVFACVCVFVLACICALIVCVRVRSHACVCLSVCLQHTHYARVSKNVFDDFISW